MFSGKTEELIRRLKRARIARQRVEIFKPALDTRFSASDVVSHDESAIPCAPVSSAAEQILLLAADADVMGIDEAQFFSSRPRATCARSSPAGQARHRGRASTRTSSGGPSSPCRA